MRTSLLITVAGLAAGLTGCATSGAHSAHAGPQLAQAQCEGVVDADQQVAQLYAPGRVVRVEPLYRQRTVMQHRPSQDLAGAGLLVAAPAGVTSAYLERALSCHATGQVASAEHPNDPLRVAGVRDVDVSEQGAYLRIDIIARDRSGADAVLSRARAVRDQGGQVTIQQLAQRSQQQAL